MTDPSHLRASPAPVGKMPTLQQVAREIMLVVQFGDYGHYVERDGERVYQTSGKQTDNLSRDCDEAARRVFALLSAQAASQPGLTDDTRRTWAIFIVDKLAVCRECGRTYSEQIDAVDETLKAIIDRLSPQEQRFGDPERAQDEDKMFLDYCENQEQRK